MKRTLLALAAVLLIGTAQQVAAQLRVEKRVDLSVPVKLEAGQGAILVGFRRPDVLSAGKSGAIAFSRYDMKKRDLILQPRDAKKKGDSTTYWVLARSGDKKLALDYAVMVVSAGDYVMFGATPGPGAQVLNTMCLGAPTFHVGAGEVVYFGDLTPYIAVRLEDGSRTSAMAYSAHPDDARKALTSQPALVAAFSSGKLRNDATYACFAQEISAYHVPGIESVSPPERVPNGVVASAPVLP